METSLKTEATSPHRHRAGLRGRSMLASAVVLLLAGCIATQGVLVEKSVKPTPSGDSSGSSMPTWLPTWAGGSAPPGPAPMKNGKPIVPTIRSQLQCKTPVENYDFMGVITTRYGTEAGLRMQRLLATDFADSSITKTDREMLHFMAREMLWIPVPVEEKIGAALLAASQSELEVLENNTANKELWDETVLAIKELSAAAPPNPFETRLILLKKGEPGSLAGGVIFVDNAMLKSVFDAEKPSLDKMRFVLAHELAHIHRRHRAKRIQQLLVDSSAGLKLTRQILARAQSNGRDFSPAAMGQWVQTLSAVHDVAKELMQHNEKYEQDQEFEADACATALMIDAGAGNPLQAFKAYRADADKQAALASVSASVTAGASTGKPGKTSNSHPPNAVREAKINDKMLEYRTGDKTIGATEAAFIAPKGAAAVTGTNPKAKANASTAQGSAKSGSALSMPPTAAGNSVKSAAGARPAASPGAPVIKPTGAASSAGSGKAKR